MKEEADPLRNLTAVALKFVSVWTILLLFGLAWGPAPMQSAVIALFVAVVSWIVDLKLPFEMQDWTRWSLDAGLAAVGVYVGQFLWPGQAIAIYAAVFIGAVIGAIEIPLHFLLRRALTMVKDREWRK